MLNPSRVGLCVWLIASLGQLAQAAPSAALIGHVTWSIFHEGCRVYEVAPTPSALNDQIKPLNELRECFLGTQSHNPDAVQFIRSATDSDLQQAVVIATKQIPSQYALKANFTWVAIHEGQAGAFRRLDAARLYEGIRSICHLPLAKKVCVAIAAQLPRLKGFQYIQIVYR